MIQIDGFSAIVSALLFLIFLYVAYYLGKRGWPNG
jgi:hypothetical protein